MSVHQFTVPDERSVDPINTAARLALGVWSNTSAYAGTTLTLTYAPDLTAAQVTTLTEIVRASQSQLTRPERNGIEADVALLRTYQGIANPTLVQTVAATKAQSRILRALIRDG